MHNNRDYLIAIIAGLVTVFFVLLSLLNLGLASWSIFLGLLVGVPALWIIGLFIAKLLARWKPVFNQIGKFVVVGFLNTSIDFGVLNLLSLVSGLTAGFLIGGVNIPGFMLAATNSYFWNKFWVFKKPADRTSGDGDAVKTDYSDFFTFVLVVTTGIFINSGVVILVTTYINPIGGVSSELWLNIAKVFATIFSLTWNFLGYKFIVFRK